MRDPTRAGLERYVGRRLAVVLKSGEETLRGVVGGVTDSNLSLDLEDRDETRSVPYGEIDFTYLLARSNKRIRSASPLDDSLEL